MKLNKHYSAAIAAYIIWGFFPIPLRWIQSYPAGDILFYRIFLSLLTLVIVIALFRRKALKGDWQYFRQLTKTHRRQAILLTLAGAALLSVNWLLFIYIVNSVNVKTASFTYLICPVLTAVLGNVLLKEKLSPLQWASVGLCAASCVLIGLNSTPELVYSLITALSYALYLISQRTNQGFDRLVNLGLQVFLAFIGLMFLYNYLVSQVPSEPYFYAVTMVIAVLFTVTPLFLNLFALNKINAATIGILMYINPLLNFVLAVTIFNETVTPLQLWGYGIILPALVLFNYENYQKIRSVVRV